MQATVANLGIWYAIATAEPRMSFAHHAVDEDHYLEAAENSLVRITQVRLGNFKSPVNHSKDPEQLSWDVLLLHQPFRASSITLRRFAIIGTSARIASMSRRYANEFSSGANEAIA